MKRNLLSLLTLMLVIVAFTACKTPANDVAEPPEAEQPASADEEAREEEAREEQARQPTEQAPHPVVDDESAHVNDPACPPPQEPDGMCIQMIAYAKNPETGLCCEYPTPCHAPDGWETFPSMEACEED